MKAKSRRRFLALVLTLALLCAMCPVTAFAEGETYSVTVDSTITGGSLAVNPAGAAAGEVITVTVTLDEGKQLVADSLKYNNGVDDIEITATEGVYSFFMPAADVTVTAQFEDIPTAAYNVDFSVTGENGSLTAAVDSVAISSGDEVAAGKTVVFTAAPDAGYQVKEWTVDSQAAADNKTNTLTVENLAAATTVTVEFEAIPVIGPTVAPADFTDGILEITQGGTYTLDTRSDYNAAISSNPLGWWIQVATTEPVTIIGTGCDLEMGRAYGIMSITGTVAGIDLTVEDLFIESASYKSRYTSHVVSTREGEFDMTDICNVLNFTGAGNKLTIEGRNCFEAKSGGAAIHVGPTADLTIDGEGALYLYKTGAWTCIGGNGCEANGAITINGGNLFIKGSAMGAVIGSGSYCGDIPGDITINGGTLNLVGNARGAVIGTGAQDRNAIVAGNTDNFPDSTGKVYINGGLLNFNVDFCGAAIGQADAAGSPPIFEIPGNLYVTGGSIRTFLDQNAISFWNMILTPQLPSFGVYPEAITAAKTNGSGEPVYMLTLDTAQADAAETYSVQVDGEEYYSGGLYQYCFVQEALDKGEQHTISTTVSNWVPSADPNLYLYLTGENHTLTINGETFEAIWNSESESFTVARPGSAYTLTLTGDGISSDPVAGEIAAGTAVTITVAPAEGKRVATFTVGGVDKKAELTANQYTFNMQATATEVAVTYEDIATAAYTVNFSVTGENGSLTAAVDSVAISSGDEVAAGKTVVFTAAPAAGYQVKEWTVDSQAAADNKTNSLTLENLAAAKTVTVEFEPAAPVLNEDVYELSLADHMLWFANQVNTGTNTAIKGKLMNSIDLSGITWTPIGSSSASRFAGVFDGNGKTVTLAISGSASYIGLFGYVNGGTVKDLTVAGSVFGNQYVAGIAAYVNGASVIQNCVNNAAVTSTGYYAGGIAAYAIDTTAINGCANNGALSSASYNVGGVAGYIAGSAAVNDCANNGGVTGLYNVGGVVGDGYGANAISRCSNIGAITATSTAAGSTYGVGGVVGYANTDVTIDQCANRGAVSGVVMNVGGVVGYQRIASGTLTNSYNTGSVTSASSSATAHTGGVVGRMNNAAGTVQNTYNAGIVTGNGTSPNTAGVIGYAAGNTNVSNNYYLDATAAKGLGSAADNAVSKTSDELKSSEFLAGLNADGRSFVVDTNNSNSGYPVLRTMTEDTSTLISITKNSDPNKLSYIVGQTFDPAGLVIWANYSDGTREKVTGYTVSKTTALETTDNTITVSGTHDGTPYNFEFPITVDGPPAMDDNNVYQLVTVNEMIWFANQVNTGLNTAIKGKLAQDIDLSAISWTPIGSEANRYAGIFDGNGKTVTLAISGAANFYGLFGSVDGGTVKNLTVAGSVSGDSYIAGIVASARGAAVIENCVNNATVTGTSINVGGIAGYIIGTTAVSDCVNNGNVSGSNYIGGIVGNNSVGACVISRCVNTGAITATSASTSTGYSVGGIVGNAASTIDQCANSGAVNGSVMSVGGVVGYLNNAAAVLTNSYNTGSVTSTSSSATAHTGGVIGRMHNADCTVQNTYNAGAVTGNGTSPNTAGVIGYAAGNTNVSNNYYLDTTAEKGLGNATDNALAKTEAEMKSTEFAGLLGDVYIAQADTYPVLTWQGAPAPTTYSVTVDSAVTGGTVAVSTSGGEAGDIITVTATPAEGKQLVAGSLKYTADGDGTYTPITETGGVYSFVLPAADVTVTAQFVEIPVELLTPPVLTADTSGNTLGQAVDITFPTDAAWEAAISGITVNDTALTAGQYTVNPGSINIAAGAFDAPGDHIIIVTATGYEDATVIQTITANGGPQVPVTLSLSPAAAQAGETVTASGTAPANTWISLKVLDDGQNIVVFDAVKSDSQGNYSISFIVPETAGETLTVITGYGTNIAPATLSLKLTPPALQADTDNNVVGQDIDITFTDDADWRTAISGITVNGTPLTTGQYTVTAGNINIAAAVFTTVGDYSIVVTADGYKEAQVTQAIEAKTPPALVPDSSDNTVGQAIDLTFAENADWQAAISGITLGGNPLTSEQYTVSAGNINIAAGAFSGAGSYQVVVSAANYSDTPPQYRKYWAQRPD